MKKFSFVLLSLVLVLVCGFSASNFVVAENTDHSSTTTTQTYYAKNIEDYVDLTNLEAFAVSYNHFYYSVKTDTNYLLCRYNFETKIHEQLKSYPLNDGNKINSLKHINGNLFVLLGDDVYVYNENDFSTQISTALPKLNTYDITFNNNIYTFAVKVTEGETHTLKVLKHSSLTSSADTTLSLTLDYKIKDLAINDNYIYVAGEDNYFHIYKHSEVTTLAETSNSKNNNPHTISSLFDINAFTLNNTDYFAVTASAGLYIYNNDYNSKGHIASSSATIAAPLLFDFNIISNSALNVYVYDYSNINIQKINVSSITEGFALNTPEIVLAGKGKTLGRFDNANSITLKNENTLFVSDKNNNRIQILTNNNIKEIELGENVYASNLILDENNNLLYLKHTTSGIYLCGKAYNNGNYSTNLFNDKPLSSTTKSMCISLSGKIYFLDYANNTISCLNAYDESFTSISLQDITTNSNSIIKYSNTYGEIILSVDNKLYRVAIDTGILNTAFIETATNIDAFEIDFNNNIFILSNNQVIKTTFENINAADYINLNFNTNTFTINQSNGNFYVFNNGRSCLEIVKNSTFSDGLTQFPHQTEEIFSNTAYNNVLKYGTINEHQFIYDNVNFVGNFYYTPENSVLNVLILQENLTSNSFVRVGYVQNNTLKIGYVKNKNVTITSESMTSKEYSLRTTNQTVSVFKYPTLASNVVVDTISIGTPITAIGTYGINIDDNGFFYVVKINNKIGYIYNGDVVSNTNISSKVETNAVIRILDHSDIVYLYSQPDENSSKIIIEEGQRIYVKNYNKSHTYTLISYTDSEHVEHVGYVLTKYIDMDGVNSTLITAIVLFTLTIILGVTLLVFYIFYKKKQHTDTDEETPKTNPLKTNKSVEKTKINEDENN